VNIVEVTCGAKGCGYSPFPMEEGFYKRCVRTHETWYCPGGHARAYLGKTAEEEKIERLLRDNDRLLVTIADLREALNHPWCLWPGCEFRATGTAGLRTHMRAKHGMPTLATVQEDVA
jgi:hypothetical protein